MARAIIDEKETQSLQAREERRALFRSMRLGSLVLPNRLVMAPMTRGFSPHGIPGPLVADYYRRRAIGGVGLIITEGTYVGHESAVGYPDAPMLAGKEQLAGWKEVVRAVHAAGGRIFPQLWHTGSYCRPGFDRSNLIQRLAPSAVAHPGLTNDLEKRIPKRMCQGDIDDLIASYASAAKNAIALGFDGIEIHGAHGYLIDQFFWELTNKRQDRYGGNIENRTRFACEIVQEVRKATSPDFPICFRFSNWKLNVYDSRGAIFHNPKDLERFLLLLSDAGVDVFHASSRRFDTPLFPDSSMSLAGWTKKLSSKPTITVGSVGLDADFISERQGAKVASSNLADLIQRMETEDIDLVAVGRALLCDPEWVNKIRQHDDRKIIPYDRASLMGLR